MTKRVLNLNRITNKRGKRIKTKRGKRNMTKELTNRKWQKHFLSKGFVPFMYDRLLSYALSMRRQYNDNPFYFPSENNEDNPLVKYFFEFVEEFPYEIYVEVTNHCNLNCIFCARKAMQRSLGFMPMELYKKVIDEIAEKRPFAHVHLYGIGESTIDPHILERIRYTLQKGVSNLVLFTNGKTLLRNDFYKDLVDTGIGTIGIDVDGFSKETYEKIRVGGNFEQLKESVVLIHNYIREKNLNTRVELAFQVYEEINGHELEAFKQWANENDYEYKVVFMHQWAGLREDIPTYSLDQSRESQRKGPCSSLWTSFMILWNGDVALCFLDADGKEVHGNLSKSSIEEVWAGSLREKRKEQVQGTIKGLCSNCRECIYNTTPSCNSSLYPEVLRT